MCRNPQAFYPAEVGMRRRIEGIGKQLENFRSAELVGWQADGMDHDQLNRNAFRSLIAVRRRHLPCSGEPVRGGHSVRLLPHSFIPNRAMR